jgi:catechol 2,3-dioxygenase-like lactoylglutathione lyase family enzyme
MALDVRGVTTLLQVYDMPVSVRFYRDVLGFQMVSHSPHLGGHADQGGDPDRFHWCWLRLGGAEVMLNTAYEFDEERPVPPDAARVAAHGDTGLFIGSPDVDAVYEELSAKGLDVKKPHVAPYGMKQLSLSDPDGYGICFQWEAKP